MWLSLFFIASMGVMDALVAARRLRTDEVSSSDCSPAANMHRLLVHVLKLTEQVRVAERWDTLV